MPVIKIKSTHPESQGPFVLIEEADFDPEKHERVYEKPTLQPKEAAAPSPSVAADAEPPAKPATSKSRK